MKLEPLRKKMTGCKQSQNQTILEHGIAVSERFGELIQLIGGTADAATRARWKLPPWFISHGEKLLALCPSADALAYYHIYHDCGKPFCHTIGHDGKPHFPNHAAVSASIWRVAGGSEQIAQLIQHDMDMHLLKPSGGHTYARIDLAPALLLTALSEIHANADMFGGMLSTSFCIKWKGLSKLGNNLLPLIFKEQS